TLTPAILSLLGEKVLSRRKRRALAEEKNSGPGSSVPGSSETGAEQPAPRPSIANRFFGRWVTIVTARPLLTVLAVLVLLGASAIPALQLRLALPGAETLPEDDPARITYELTGEHFGEGTNGPLLLTGSIITSTDPLGLM